MSLQTWQETLVTMQAAGAALTAAAAASMLETRALYTVPPNFFERGKKIRIEAQGRISVVVTTPGTARFDIRLGGTVVFDTAALNLNVVAKTNVPWWLTIDCTCRAAGNGTLANLMGVARFQSEAVVGAAANTAGGNGSLLAPVGAPTVGAGFNSTISQLLDVFFTQTVATGSLTCEQYELIARN